MSKPTTQPDRNLIGLGWVGLEHMNGLGSFDFRSKRPCWIGQWFGLGKNGLNPTHATPSLDFGECDRRLEDLKHQALAIKSWKFVLQKDGSL